MKNNMGVLLTTAASCRAVRIPALAAADLLLWETGTHVADVSAEAGAAKGLGRVITAPTTLAVQGTGVSAYGPGEGTMRHDRRRHVASTINPINRDFPTNFSTKQTIVVDDTPGVRSWSPPV